MATAKSRSLSRMCRLEGSTIFSIQQIQPQWQRRRLGEPQLRLQLRLRQHQLQQRAQHRHPVRALEEAAVAERVVRAVDVAPDAAVDKQRLLPRRRTRLRTAYSLEAVTVSTR
jgi:hypothetical protein